MGSRHAACGGAGTTGVTRSSLGRGIGTTTLRAALRAVLGRGQIPRPASPAAAPLHTVRSVRKTDHALHIRAPPRSVVSWGSVPSQFPGMVLRRLTGIKSALRRRYAMEQAPPLTPVSRRRGRLGVKEPGRAGRAQTMSDGACSVDHEYTSLGAPPLLQRCRPGVCCLTQDRRPPTGELRGRRPAAGQPHSCTDPCGMPRPPAALGAVRQAMELVISHPEWPWSSGGLVREVGVSESIEPGNRW
jgi:hypothetical protein